MIETQDSLTLTNGSNDLVEAIRFDGIPIPSLPHTESWVFAVLALLFLLIIYAFHSSFDWTIDALRNIIKKRTRTSNYHKITFNEYQARLILVIVAIKVITLNAYLYLSTSGELQLSTYLSLLLFSALFVFGKHIVILLLTYIFSDKEISRLALAQYYNIIALLGIVLFPVLAIKIYFPLLHSQIIFDVLIIISIGLAMILIVIKLFQFFYLKILDFFYILLYLCSLEIIPLIGIYKVYQLIL